MVVIPISRKVRLGKVLEGVIVNEVSPYYWNRRWCTIITVGTVEGGAKLWCTGGSYNRWRFTLET